MPWCGVILAAFWWEQPGWLVFVLALTGALAGYVRLEGVAARRGHVGWRWLGAGAGAGGSAVVGTWLASAGTTGAMTLLGGLALFAGGWLALAQYCGAARAPVTATRVILVGLRCVVWLALLLMLARPTWEWMAAGWRKPVLVVLLDQSGSMELTDGVGSGHHPTRAELVNAGLDRARRAIKQLPTYYDVRLRAAGLSGGALEAWKVTPQAPMSPLGAAVREAGATHSEQGRPPAGVILVSDGADNVGPAGELRRVGAELAAQGTALWAVGVGPEPGSARLIELEGLAVPARLGLHDRLRVPVSGRAQGCAGGTVTVDLLWDADVAGSQAVQIEYEVQHVGGEFEVAPPSPGLHRLIARATLPKDMGGHSFSTMATVDVQDERIRVLWLEGAPRTEAAVAARALQADPQFDITRRFLFTGDERGTGAERPESTWSEFDVVVLGSVPPIIPEAALRALSQAVGERGVGVLLCGGRRLLNDTDYGHAALRDISPVGLVRDEFGLAGPVRFVPTELGMRHPILAGVGTAEAGRRVGSQPGERDVWAGLPALGGAALLGVPKAAATVLAEDAAGRALLVAQEFGRGRCVAAGWESTWAWALASDEGRLLHRRLWRQLIGWLANRRPRAWVLTDEPTYALSALTTGQRQVQIRAGVAGLESAGFPVGRQDLQVHLKLSSGGEPVELRLEDRGDEWSCALAGPPARPGISGAGTYVLDLSVSPTRDGQAGVESAEGETWAARTTFTVLETQLERQPPTANLALLRAAAEETARLGGAYCDVRELPNLLERLAHTDHREPVWERHSYGVVEREPWALLAALVLFLGMEWAIRKRVGLP